MYVVLTEQCAPKRLSLSNSIVFNGQGSNSMALRLIEQVEPHRNYKANMTLITTKPIDTTRN